MYFPVAVSIRFPFMKFCVEDAINYSEKEYHYQSPKYDKVVKILFLSSDFVFRNEKITSIVILKHTTRLISPVVLLITFLYSLFDQ